MKRVWLVVGIIAIAVAIVWWRKHAPDEPRKAVDKPTVAKQLPIPKRVDQRARKTATISGTVRDEEGKPLVAEVCAVYTHGERCTTSTGGAYRIADLVPDAVSVTASLARFQPEVVDVYAMRPGEQRVIDLVLSDGAVEITGVVEDILGGPIAAARVSAGAVRTTADDRGRFTLWAQPGKDFVFVNAIASGYSSTSKRVRAPANLVLALAPESTISGRVVDIRDTPVAGARVSASGQVATSAADGTFTLEQLAPGPHVLQARTPDTFGRLDRQIVIGIGERVDGVVLRVHPARVVVATIENATDCDPEPALHEWSSHAPKPWRDEDGRYHFESVPPGTYAVELGCGGRAHPLVVGDSDVAVTWRVPGGGIVRGTVAVEGGGGKLVDISLRPTGHSKRFDKSFAPASARTFELRGVPAGRYTLTARIDHAAAAEHVLEVVDGKTIEQNLALRMKRTGRVVGRVVDKDKRPIASGTIRFDRYYDDARPAQIRGGRYEITLPAGNYNANIWERDIAGGGRVEVQEDQTITLDIEVVKRAYPDEPEEQRYELRGIVVDGAGTPVAGALVRSTYDDPKYDGIRATTSADGSFAIVTRVSPMQVEINRVGGGSKRAILRTGEVQTIVLGSGGTIAGTAVHPDGSLATRFFVQVASEPVAQTLDFSHTGGRFAITVDKFPITIVAGHNQVIGPPITIDRARDDLVVPMPELVTVRGRIVDAATQRGVPLVRIHGRREGPTGWSPWFIHADQVTDDDGRFTLRDLPPGPVTLELIPPSDTWSTQKVSVTIPKTAGDIGEFSLSQVRRK